MRRPAQAPPRWLLLIHELPPSPAYLRVKTARQLQKIGAAAVKDSVYVLPNTEAAHQSFTWLSKEINAGGGDANLCEANFVGGSTNSEIEALFQIVRGQDYQQLAEQVRSVLKALGKTRRQDEGKRVAAEAALARFQRRMDEIAQLDFFTAPGRGAASSLITTLEARLCHPSSEAAAPKRHTAIPVVKGAVWVTRKGVHVDRIACAWLIKRFIDPSAKLMFVPATSYPPADGELRYDLLDAEQNHDGDRCTFELLMQRFGVVDASVTTIGELVHDIDVCDGKFQRAETAGLEMMIKGIPLTQTEDEARVALGAGLFDALYETLKRKRS
jgi:hypothetical protein